MAAELPVYSSRKVNIAFLGQDVTGVAETFANIQRNTDFTNETVGADGSVEISVSPDRTGTFELTLKQTSPANAFLAGVIAAQDQTGDLYRGSFTLTDESGGAIVKLSKAHIKSGPQLTFGSEAQDRTWTIFCTDYIYLEVPEGIADTAADLANIAATAETLSQFKV